MPPIVIGYDGSPASAHAIRSAGKLLTGKSALVVSVWSSGLAFDALEAPTISTGLPPAPIDYRAAAELDQAVAERAQRLAQQGADLATDAGFQAEALAVADDAHVSIAESLWSVAQERDAEAIVVGAHGHGRLGEVFLGSTSRDVMRRARCPVIVVRDQDDS